MVYVLGHRDEIPGCRNDGQTHFKPQYALSIRGGGGGGGGAGIV